MLIIGFGHRRQVGKDTAARFLATWLKTERKGKAVVRKGFADKLYDVCYSLYFWAGFQTRQYYDEHPEDKETVLILLGKSPRTILIEIGNYIRKVYLRTWIDNLLQSTKVDILIIPDVRYYNEMTAIRALGGFVYRIDRADIEKFDDLADGALAECTEWDGIIVNDSTQKVFHDRIISIISERHF